VIESEPSSVASPIARYLRSVAIALDRHLEAGSDDNDKTFSIRRAIQQIVETAIEQQTPERELNLLAETLTGYLQVEPSQGYGYPDLAFKLLLVPGIDLIDLVELPESIDRGTFELGKLLGFSKRDLTGFRELVAFSDSPEEKLAMINADLSSFLQSNSEPWELRRLMGMPAFERDRLSPEWQRIQTRGFISIALTNESIALYERIHRDLPIIFDGMVVINALNDEQRETFSEKCDALFAAVRELSYALDPEADWRTVVAEVEDRLRPIVSELLALGDSTRERKIALMEKVKSVGSEARVLIVPRILALIERNLALPVSPMHFSLLESLVDAFVGILNRQESPNSLIILGHFLDRNSFLLLRLVRENDEQYEINVLRLSFDLAHYLGVRFLHDYPHVLPGWSAERIMAVRQIIGSFLRFDGPTEWRRNEIFSLIPRGDDSQLQLAVKILTRLHAERCVFPEKTPVINSGRWLRSFLLERESRFGSWVRELVHHRFLAKMIATKLFHKADVKISEFLDVPSRFISMSERMHVLNAKYRGAIPERFFDIFNSLASESLRKQVNLGFVDDFRLKSPFVHVVESAIFASFDVLEAVGRKGYGNLAPANIEAFSECAVAAGSMPYLIGDAVNGPLQQSIETNILKASELADAIDQETTVSLPFFQLPRNY